MTNLLHLYSNATSNIFDNLLQKEDIQAENSQYVLFAKDPHGKYIAGSNPYTRIAGLSKADDIIGHHDFELSWAPEAEETVRHDQIVLQTKSPKMFLEYGTGHDGYMHKAVMYKFPLFSRRNKVIGVICLGLLINHRKHHLLTPRELECVKYISRGNSIKETAKFLQISPRTVEHHINNVKTKMSAKNIVELIAILAKQNII